MSDIEDDYGSDQEVSKEHSKLIEAVSKLDKGQRVKKPQRSEPSLEVSEFHLVKSGISDKDAISVNELAKTLGGKGHHAIITKKFRATKNAAKVLPKPLEKPAADKLKRAVGFSNVKKELNEWNAIVSKNRTAETLIFPLKQPSTRVNATDDFVKRFRLQSDLEKELAALEPQKPAEEEKVDEFPLTLEEIMQRRKEAAKFRAQQSYREAKAHRQNKIKSKKFHRIQRKAKIKQQLKEFEELQKSDPQAALKKLEELDKSRAEERMSLRHKSTGQWAKNKQVRAKYDKDSRQVLAQQLSISKALTQKIRSNEDSDDDEDIANDVSKPSANDRDNPWVNGVKTTSEIDDFITGYRKYWDEKNKASKDNKAENEKTSGSETTEMENVESSKPKIIYENPVVSVTEEHDETKENVNASRKISKSKKIAEKKKKLSTDPPKIEKASKISEKKSKLSTRKDKAKKTLKRKKSGTTEWHVEPLIEHTNNDETSLKKRPIDIDDLFETMEDKMINRIDAKLKSVKRKLATNTENLKNSDASESDKTSKEYVADLTFKKIKLRPDLDEEMNENIGISGNLAGKSSSLKDDSMRINDETEAAKKATDEIDPNKFINVKPKHLVTMMPDAITNGEEALDDNEEDGNQHDIISEAFADDDVVDEFRKEKAEEIKKSQPEDIDLRLPGWGSWGGKDIVKSKRKKRRFIIKFPKKVKRRDENKGDVIIIEEKDPKIREHQVTELPYPFNSVEDFETSIRAPIGRNFVTENAHRRFIRPAVRTKMGMVIDPMDADVLIDKKKKSSQDDFVPKEDNGKSNKADSKKKKRKGKTLAKKVK